MRSRAPALGGRASGNRAKRERANVKRPVEDFVSGLEAARHTAAVPGAERDAVFVLVHSPLVGPTAWSRVARELKRREREAVVPSLLGIAGAEAPQWRHAPEAVRAATARAQRSSSSTHSCPPQAAACT